MYGGSGADELRGTENIDYLAGESGRDSLYGYEGADFLDGDDGDDYIKDYFGANSMVVFYLFLFDYLIVWLFDCLLFIAYAAFVSVYTINK